MQYGQNPSVIKLVRIISLICTICLLNALPSTAANQNQKETTAKSLLQRINEEGLFNDSSFEPLLELKIFAEENDLTSFTIEAYYLLGKYYLLRLNADEARRHFKVSAQLAEKSEQYEKQGFALDRLGISYLRLEQADSALLCFQKTSELYHQNHLEYRLWNSLQGVSTVYQFKGDYKRAKQYGDDALQSIKGFDEEIAHVILLNYMMSLAREFNALEDYANYLDEYLKTLGPQQLGKGDMHLAAYFSTDSDPKQRIVEITIAIEQLSKYEPTLSLLSGYQRLGGAYFEIEDYQNAIISWKKGLEIDQEVNGAGFNLVFTESLARAYSEIRNYEQALYYLQRNQAISDSVSRLENTKRIDELQVQFETAQKEKTIQSQQFELKAKNRQQNLLILIGAFIAIFAAAIIFALRGRLQWQRKLSEQQKHVHDVEMSELEQKNKLTALNAMLQGQEEERKRIANDLHDGLGGLLTTVKFQYQNLFDQTNGRLNADDINKANQMLDDACGEVRRISHNMMPHALLKMGLDAAINDMVTSLNRNSNIEISYNNMSDIGRMKESSEIMLYRIVQELLQNAFKHSRATSIIVQLSQHNGTLSLVVEDNGTGFDQSASKSQGIGLESVKSRVQFMNGKTDIQAIPGTGTTISIEIPKSEVMLSADLKRNHSK